MREYYVLYKTAEGALKEQRVSARNHKAAMEIVVAKGCEVVKVSRVEDADADSYRRVGSPMKSASIAILLGLAALALGAAFLWLRK